MSHRTRGEYFPALVDGEQVPDDQNHAQDVVHHVVQRTPRRDLLCPKSSLGVFEGGNATRNDHHHAHHRFIHDSFLRRVDFALAEVPPGR